MKEIKCFYRSAVSAKYNIDIEVLSLRCWNYFHREQCSLKLKTYSSQNIGDAFILSFTILLYTPVISDINKKPPFCSLKAAFQSSHYLFPECSSGYPRGNQNPSILSICFGEACNKSGAIVIIKNYRILNSLWNSGQQKPWSEFPLLFLPRSSNLKWNPRLTEIDEGGNFALTSK